MSGKRSSAPKKRKNSGGSGATWLLYPLAVVVGTSAGVAYHFSTLPAPRPAPKETAKATAPSATLEPASQPRTRRKRRRPAAPDEPSVQVRSLDGPETGETTVTGTPTAPVSGEVHVLPPTEIERGAGKRPEVALTFDAGSDWRPVKAILAALEQRGVKATFFLTGEWVEKNPKTTQLIVSSGHEIGNHSWNHPAFTHLSDDEVREQLRRTEALLQEVTGKTTRPYFRPPLGDRDARVRRLVGEEGFLTIYWTLDSRDSVDRGITAEQIRQRVVDKSSAGSIVLLHCGSQATAEALPAVLDGLEQRGLTQVPLSRLLQE